MAADHVLCFFGLRRVCVMPREPRFKRRPLGLIHGRQSDNYRGCGIPLGPIGPILQLACLMFSFPIGDLVCGSSFSGLQPFLHFNL